MKILPKKFIFFSTLALLVGCSGQSSTESSKNSKASIEDNVIRIVEQTKPATVFPQKITNTVERLIASQIHEGLVKFNPKDLTIEPGLAESWEIDVKNKIILFHLRKGSTFQNAESSAEKGDEITSKDVKYTFELLSTKSAQNLHFNTVCKDRIVGANEFYNKDSKNDKIDLKGFKIIDDYTFSIELLNTPGTFLEILANPVAAIISKKAYESLHENLYVGAGPFTLDKKSSTETHFVLFKNKNYYAKDKEGNSLPYIDSLIFDIVATSEDALDKFEHSNIDFINYIPTSQVSRVVSENIKSFKNPPKYVLNQNAEMVNSYYLFNSNKAPFNNKKLRQAINYAIDRSKLIDRVLLGQAYGPAIYGIVPPTFDYYNTKNIVGYDLNIEKAKTLLREAGYPNAKGLPEIQLILNSGKSRNSSVAVEIQKQLKTNLNIDITFESVTELEKISMETGGKSDLYNSAWAADYPNPESFLSVFYSNKTLDNSVNGAYPNTTNYSNKEFDKFYQLGRDAINKDSAISFFMKAEQILMNDAPIIPLWYEGNYRLIKFRVKNFYSNPIGYCDFSQVKVLNN